MARLATELREALQLQAATANILKIIAASPTAVEPALGAIVQSASQLCGGCDASVFLRVGDDLHFSAHHGPIPTSLGKRPINRNWVAGRSVVDKIPVQVSDFLAPAAAQFPEGQELGRRFGHRCALSVPLLREGEAIGAIALRRLEPGAFSGKQIDLLQTFANQAMIAIENVRLLEHAQARARDLEASLMQQTATAEVLKVINCSTFDLQSVLSALVETVARFCQADFVLIHRRETERYRCIATFGLPPEYKDYIRTHTFPVDRGTLFGRAVMDRKVVEVEDLAADPEYLVRKNIALGKGRAALAAPLLRDGNPIGAIVVARNEPVRFTQRQIELVSTFADQAAIAIENVRLFEQAQAKSLDLEESLMQQTATADVLKVINRSTFDLQPVLDALVEKAAQFCHADYALILRREGDRYRAVATFGLTSDYENYIRANTFATDRGTVFGRAVLDQQVVEVEDIATDPDYQVRQTVLLGNGHSALAAPLLREGKPIGAIAVARRAVRRFTERQIELVATFANQAAIAMENTRLMIEQRDRHLALEQEVRRRTQELESSEERYRNMLEQTHVAFCERTTAAIRRRLDEARAAGCTDIDLHLRNNPSFLDECVALCRITNVNNAFLKMRGISSKEDVIGRTDHAFSLRDAIYRLVKEMFAGNVRYERKASDYGGNGKFMTVLMGCVIVDAMKPSERLLYSIVDITELERVQEALMSAQQELARASRIATAGAISTSIAHDLNQPLGAVIMDTQACLRWLQRSPPDHSAAMAAADRAVRNSVRASEIVKRTRERLMKDRRQVATIDIERLVRDTIVLLEREIATHRVSVSSAFDGAGLCVDADRTELQQVLVNLMMNALHSMSSSDGAKRLLSVDVKAPTAGRIEVAVRDTGHGISSDSMRQLFEPFFTTKAGGMGMGLSICQATVQAWGGCIKAENHPGGGAVFTFDLPLSEQHQVACQAPACFTAKSSLHDR